MSIKEVDIMMESFTGIHQEYVASQVRSQICEMQNILEKLESDTIGYAFMDGCLKQVENNLRNLRKSYKGN